MRISGRIEFDPELRFTAQGTPLCTFDVLVDGTDMRVRCNAWAELGELIAENYQRYHAGVNVILLGKDTEREFQGRTIKEFRVQAIEIK